MEETNKIKSIIEALLIASESGLTREEMQKAIGDADMTAVDEAINILKDEYEKLGRAFTIGEIAGKCRIVTKPEYMLWIQNLYQPEPDRLTRPALETLAIIAYKQPLTRAEMEGIRGVNVDGVIKTLLAKELIVIKGRKDVIGKPLLYGTGEKFLEHFGLNSLSDLPQLKDFTEEDLDFGKPQKGQIIEIEQSITEKYETAQASTADPVTEAREKQEEPPAETLPSEFAEEAPAGMNETEKGDTGTGSI